jgi:hypothetical protein
MYTFQIVAPLRPIIGLRLNVLSDGEIESVLFHGFLPQVVVYFAEGG